jgi:CBS domain containing-hemolysin-like protein
MSLGLDLAVALVAGALLVLLSTIETAYGQISDVSLHILRGGGRPDRREAFFAELMAAHDRFRMALLFGINAAVIAIAVVTARSAFRFGVPRPWLTSLAVALALVFVLSLVVPGLVVRNAPERVLLRLMPLFKPYYRAVSIVVTPLTGMLSVFRTSEQSDGDDADESPDVTMSDIQALIGVAEEEGIIEEAEGAMIQSIVELGETHVHEVMTPRTQIVAIPSTATVIEARDLMVASKHSRLPVYAEHIDNVEGVLYVRDVLAAWSDGLEGGPVTVIMRPAYFVPEVKPVADLLEEMRKSQMQIALVIDEYGAVAGVITIEDLLEEIVGEIEDEDVVADEDDIVRDADGSVLVKGSTEIRKIELELNTELEADDFTTVAGLIINELGHLPSRGERLEFRGLEFEVVEADSRRVKLVRLKPIAKLVADESQEATQQG